MHGLVPKSDFIGLEGITSLAAGGAPPLLKQHRQAFEQYAHDKSQGYAGYLAHWVVNDAVRELLATMLNLQARDIALLGSASEGIVQAISSIDWREGDNAVTLDIEYASGRFAISELSRLGVEYKAVNSREMYIDLETIIQTCDDRTRLVYLSQVNYITGQHLDIPSIFEALAARGIALLNDVSHALGVVPVDGRCADFLVCCCYKWLLGTHTGIFAWNRQNLPVFSPQGVGWRSALSHENRCSFEPRTDARRAQVGNSNHLDIYLLQESLNYIRKIGINDIQSHVLSLGARLIRALEVLGLRVITPVKPRERAGNICFLHDDPLKIVRLAAAEGLHIWGDDGRVRASIHLFNDDDDIDKLIDFLTRVFG